LAHCLAVVALVTLTQVTVVPIASDGKPQAHVILAAAPTPAEQTAARELAQYLTQVTGGQFAIETEGHAPAGPGLYVGPTKFAARHAVDAGALGPEEWVLKVADGSLILAGGRPRGTLYAVYHFLEDGVGVRWWNPFEESVPDRKTLSVAALDRRRTPVFRYRDIYTLYGRDGGRFAARNRLNRQGDARISGEYGGSMDYGPPYHVHTFFKYLPPKQYFKAHPEYYSEIKGRRVADRTQLCLTNPEVRRLVKEKLRQYIEQSWAAAKEANRPPPLVFDISQNDWGGPCQCAKCQAIVKREGSEAGVLLDFINEIADSIKDDYPNVYIDTLAYHYTLQAPKTIRPRDNVIIRLCDLSGSDFSKPQTDPANKSFHDQVIQWSKIAKNLRIWDYAVTYGRYHGLPFPSLRTMPVDYQFFAEHNVEGMFIEHEFPIAADMRDLKIWVQIKLLEDPYRDYEALVKDFMAGFYGPAGRYVYNYLKLLERAADEKPSYIGAGATPWQYAYIDLRFVTAANELAAQALKAAQEDPVLSRRVRHAFMSLDRATLFLWKALADDFVAGGGKPEQMPLDRKLIADRYKTSWYEQIDLRLPENQRAAKKAAVDQEVQTFLAMPAFVELPEQFRGRPPGSVLQFTPESYRLWKNIAKEVTDPESSLGLTCRLELSEEDLKKYKLPMPWGVYDQAGKKTRLSRSIRPQDVPNGGYNLYKLGTLKLGQADYVYFFWSWIIQCDIGRAVNPREPEQSFDVYASIKFDGPAFPHGAPDEKNAISVERVIVAKAGGK